MGRPVWRLTAAADTLLGCDGSDVCVCVCWGEVVEDEDEEVEGDCLSSELTMFDRQQRRGGVAGLLVVVGGGTSWVGAVLVPESP